MARGEATSCHLGGRETIRTNQAEIHNALVTGSRFVWLDAHANGLVTSCHRSMQGFLGNAFILGSYLRLKGQRRWVHTCQSEEKELGTNQINIRMWTSCSVLTSKRDYNWYIFCFSSLRCWITSWPLWSLSSMEWVSFASTSLTARTRFEPDSFLSAVEQCVYLLHRVRISLIK